MSVEAAQGKPRLRGIRPMRAAVGRVSWLAVAVVAVVTATHAAVAWGATLPHFQADEVSMVGNSLRIVHPDVVWDLMGGSYMPGLAFLMAPAWWFTSDAVTVFHVGLVINVILAAVAVWPLTLIARDIGASRSFSLVAAGAVSIAPAMVLSANYLVAEKLLLVATATTVHLAWRMAHGPSTRLAVALGVSGGLAFLSHGRGIVIAGALAALALVQVRTWGKLSWILALVAVASIGAGYGALRMIASPMYGSLSRESLLWDNITSLGLADAARAAIGQAWYVTLAWPAVAVIAALWIVRRLRTHAWAQYMVIAVLGTAVLSVTQTYERPAVEPRLDVWVYGRYNDHLAAVLALVGVVVLAKFMSKRLMLACVAASAAIGVAFLTFTVPRIPVGGWFVDVHIAGIAPYLDLDNVYYKRPERWLFLTGVAVGLAIVAIVASRIRSLHALVLGMLWLFQGVSYDEVSIDARDAGLAAAGRDPYAVHALPAQARIGYARDTVGGLNLLILTAWPREVTAVTIAQIESDEPPPVDIVYVGLSRDIEPPDGVLIFKGTDGTLLPMWVLPGPIADELARQGLAVEPENE